MKKISKNLPVRGHGLAKKLKLIIQTMTVVSTLAATVHAGNDARKPGLPLPLCKDIAPAANERVLFRAYAIGVQVYIWNGNSWIFQRPEAGLYADAGYHGQIGIHYQGPTWEANDGSVVRGTPVARCAPSSAIPWLRLTATPETQHGRFSRVTSIQRVNTVGGTIPNYDGTNIGEEAHVPYTAEYYFYTTYGH